MTIKAPSKQLLESIAWHQGELSKAFVQAFNMTYLVDTEDAQGKGRFIVPARHVYDDVARQFNVLSWKMGFQRYCKRVVQSLGAVHFKYDGFAFFRGVRRRDECESKSIEVSNQFKRDCRFGKMHSGDRVLGFDVSQNATRKTKLSLVDEWEKRLASEGLPAELKIALGVDWKVDDTKADIASGKVEKAQSAYWRVYRDFCILGLYLQGNAIIPIATRLQIGRRVVWNRLKFYGLTSVEDD